MKSRTSRTGTFRAASGLRATTLTLLFLLGTFFAALWFLDTPAQAQTLPDPLPNPDRVGALERVEEVGTPVTDTLDALHRRVERGAEATATAVALPEPAVTEVRDEVHGVVTELDRARGGATEHGPTLVPDLMEPATPDPTPIEEPRAPKERPDHTGGDLEGTSAPGPDPAPATPLHRRQVTHTDIVEPAAPTENVDAEPVTDQPRVQATTSSPVSATGAPATAVAGYLDSPALPGPKAADAPVRVQRPHATPVDPADDPTVSPD